MSGPNPPGPGPEDADSGSGPIPDSGEIPEIEAHDHTGETDAYSRAYSAPESEHFSAPYMPADLGLYDKTNTGYPAAADDVVAKDPGVQTVVGISYGGFHQVDGGEGAPFNGVDPGLPDVYKLKWVQGSDALLGQLGRDDVIVDSSADDQRIANAKVGQRFKIVNTDGTSFVVTVRGIVDEGRSLLGGGFIGDRQLIAAGAAQPRQTDSRFSPATRTITIAATGSGGRSSGPASTVRPAAPMSAATA